MNPPQPLNTSHLTNAIVLVYSKNNKFIIRVNDDEHEFDNSPYKELSFDNCKNCVIKIFTKIVRVSFYECYSCNISVSKPVIGSIGLLDLYMCSVSIIDTVKFVYIENCQLTDVYHSLSDPSEFCLYSVIGEFRLQTISSNLSQLYNPQHRIYKIYNNSIKEISQSLFDFKYNIKIY